MGLESATFISQLVSTNPVGATDQKSQGDDHLRLIKSVLQSTFPNLSGAVTADQTELNKLDGATVTTAEINKLSGVTATTAEINKLAGLTATTAELNKLAGVAAGLTAAELSFVDGVTSAIQTQLNAISARITSGTYTPTVSNATNLDSNTPRVCQWMRIDNVVTVSGGIALDFTAAGVESTYQLSLPVASDFAQTFQCAGSAFYDNLNNNLGEGYIKANVANNTAEVHQFAQGTAATEGRFHFQYLVI